jgi:hypothetical protein
VVGGQVVNIAANHTRWLDGAESLFHLRRPVVVEPGLLPSPRKVFPRLFPSFCSNLPLSL